MSRTIQVATVQMDVAPAPVDSRLCRAEAIAGDAAQLGADLVVLPELFNTGYVYTNDNFHHAETLNGPTFHWLKRTARRLRVHLAGTFLLIDGSDIYNSMFIVAPDGQTWRYDKSYPWGWERGYFRGSLARGNARAAVAHTSLGDLGMLICWDTAHPGLWAAYAGQVDLMVICSCPPRVTDPTFLLPDGTTLTASQIGSAMQSLRGQAEVVFGKMLSQQTAWLGVPAVNSTGCGSFDSPLPNGRLSLLGMLPFAPWLARYLPQADRLRITAGLVDACRVVSANGEQLAHHPQQQGEGFTIAEVLLKEKRRPVTPQPAAPVSRLAYLFSDIFLPWMMLPTYRHGVRSISATF
jgi:predicted amidohydrolase